VGNLSPSNGPKDTIREKLSKDKPVIFRGITYYLNAIHKASEKEAKPSIV